MLKEIRVKNYKGFKEEIAFDFSDYKDYKFNMFAIEKDLIKNAIIYGKYGSGKSNFGLAIFDLTIHLIDKRVIDVQKSNYINGDSDLDYASFKYTFKLEEKTIKYNYLKRNANSLLYEELYIDDNKIFSYNFDNHLGDFIGMAFISAETLNLNQNMNMSVLRFIAHNANIDQNNIIYKLMKFINGMLWFRATIDGNDYIGFKNDKEELVNKIIKASKVTAFGDFLKSKGINFNLEVVKDQLGQDTLIAKFKHRNYNFYEVSSHGTRILLLYYYWMLEFSQTTFVFIDEYDAFFHHSLARELILLLAQELKIQVIITTHNSDLMSNNILRPDCYFIICDNKIKSLPNCTERELREGHNLEKIFKNGGFNVK